MFSRQKDASLWAIIALISLAALNIPVMQTATRPFTSTRPARAATQRRAARNQVAIPWALSLVTITLFLPEQLSFWIFGLRLTATRLLFLILTPVLFVRLGQRMAAGRYRFVLSDLFVPLAGFWMIYAPANVDGVQEALNHAGPTALEFCIGYLATRTLLSEHGHALSFANLLCLIIAIVALLALLDPLTNSYFIKELASRLTGYFTPPPGDDSYRLGLLRASSVFEHPILLGFVSVIGMIIAVSVPIRSRNLVFMASSIGAFFALSSAPWQGILTGLGLLVYGRLFARLPHKWLVLTSLGVVGTVTLFQMNADPVGIIIRHLIFDPESGYYRVWTWNSVIFAVSPSPWFGLGFGPYPDLGPFDINHSIDSLWLVTAITCGVPGAILVALSFIGAATFPTEGPGVGLTPAESKLGTTLGIVMFLFLFSTLTVHIWGITWVLSALLIGVRAHLGELGRVERRRSRARRPVA
jgi:hypothetical protein